MLASLLDDHLSLYSITHDLSLYSITEDLCHFSRYSVTQDPACSDSTVSFLPKRYSDRVLGTEHGCVCYLSTMELLL
jgi:hypothetical protein